MNTHQKKFRVSILVSGKVNIRTRNTDSNKENHLKMITWLFPQEDLTLMSVHPTAELKIPKKKIKTKGLKIVFFSLAPICVLLTLSLCTGSSVVT